MRLSLSKICCLLLSTLVAVPGFGRGDRRKKPHSSVGASVIVEPDSPVPGVKSEKAVPPQEQVGRVERTTTHGYINTKSRQGIDVSHYQHTIDWDAVGKEKLSYVYLKATEGASLVDEYYRMNLEGARRAGISVGAYHFYRPGVAWKTQLDNLTSVVKASEQDLVPMIDIEVGGGSNFVENLRTFVEAVTKFYGKKPLLYTYQNFYNKHFQGRFTDYDWMIASYKSSPPVLKDGRRYIMWQYTSGGRVSGIRGDVDRSQIMDGYSLKKLRL